MFKCLMFEKHENEITKGISENAERMKNILEKFIIKQKYFQTLNTKQKTIQLLLVFDLQKIMKIIQKTGSMDIKDFMSDESMVIFSERAKNFIVDMVRLEFI